MLPGSDVLGAELKPDTIEAWKRYQSLTEQRIEKELSSGEGYLVQDFLPKKEREECNHEIAEGGFCILQMQTKTPEGKKWLREFVDSRKEILEHDPARWD